MAALPWLDDLRSVAHPNADTSYVVQLVAGSSTQYNGVKIMRVGLARPITVLGPYANITAAKAGCQADYGATVLVWLDDLRSSADFDATTSYLVAADETGQYNAVRINRVGYLRPGVPLGAFPTITAAKAACETDAGP